MLHHRITLTAPANACDLSPHIPDSFTSAFLAAVLQRVASHKVRLRANPVSTAGSEACVTLRIENRLSEAARLEGILLSASTLIEPAEYDVLELEVAAKDLIAYLDEGHGRIEREAIAVLEGRSL